MTNQTNDIQLYLDELDIELEKKRLPKRDRILFKGMKYLVEENIKQRQDISTLQKHDLVGLAVKYPRVSFMAFVGLFFINSLVNWSGLRKPLLQAIVYQIFGVLIPLDQIW